MGNAEREAAKAAKQAVREAKADVTIDQQAQPTAAEVAIAKFEERLAKMKHIDAKVLAHDYVFPLLRKIAKHAGDLEEKHEDLAETVENMGEVAAGTIMDAIADALEDARDYIVKSSELMDEVMVASGFYTVTAKGLQATNKVPADLKTKYEEIGADAAEVATDIIGALQTIEAQAGAGDDDGDEQSEKS